MSKSYNNSTFNELHKCLEANKPCKGHIFLFIIKLMLHSMLVPWALGLDSVKNAVSAMDSAEGQRFIEECLLRILHIMTQQR